MSEIVDLLEKLKLLDEPTYKYYLEGMISRGSGFTAKMVMTQVQEAWLQFGIQRAIAAKGWAYQVSCTFQGTPFGKIITKNEDGTKTFHPDQAGSSPASALLSAYIACLESHP